MPEPRACRAQAPARRAGAERPPRGLARGCGLAPHAAGGDGADTPPEPVRPPVAGSPPRMYPFGRDLSGGSFMKLLHRKLVYMIQRKAPPRWAAGA